jgi:hypothetical protein
MISLATSPLIAKLLFAVAVIASLASVREFGHC